MEIAAWANRCYIMTRHNKRRFPEKVDYCTSAGFLGSRKEREVIGVRGKGPQAVVTDMAVMKPDENGELQITALHPDVDLKNVKENTGWDIKVSRELKDTIPPSENELKILYEELDPTGIYLTQPN
jgi:glutaconate CoA-transferase subunit B